MNDLEWNCRLLVRAYPASYRAEKEDEIAGVLAEMAPAGRSWPPLGDAVSVVAHGLQRRLGMTADQPTGTLLDSLAAPALVMAAVLASCALVFGEWAPWAGRAALLGRTWGPFSTDGPPVYLAVVMAAAAQVAGWRGLARALAGTTWALALAVVVLPRFGVWPGRPPLSFLALLLFLALPAAVAPQAGALQAVASQAGVRPLPAEGETGRWPRTRFAWAAVAGFTALLLGEAVHVAAAGSYGWGPVAFYRIALSRFTIWLPAVALAAVAAASLPGMVGRRGPARAKVAGLWGAAAPVVVLSVGLFGLSATSPGVIRPAEAMSTEQFNAQYLAEEAALPPLPRGATWPAPNVAIDAPAGAQTFYAGGGFGKQVADLQWRCTWMKAALGVPARSPAFGRDLAALARFESTYAYEHGFFRRQFRPELDAARRGKAAALRSDYANDCQANL